MFVGFNATSLKFSFSSHFVVLVPQSTSLEGYTKCNSKNFGMLYTIVKMITGVTNQRVLHIPLKKNLCADFGTINLSHNLNSHYLNLILAAVKRLHIIKVCQWTIQVVFSELGHNSPMYNMGIFKRCVIV